MDHASLRKAAILVRSLDADAAAAIVSQLSSEEARALRDAIRELGAIEEDERESLLSELRSGDRRREPSHAGVELSLSFAADNTPPQTPPSDHATAEDSPFDWLEEGDLPSLAERLEREQVSTVALVLSLLPAKRAGAVLSALPSQLQCDALARLAELGDVDPASLQLVEADLEDWLRDHKATQRRRLDRQSSIASILEYTSATTREHVTVSLGRQGAEWLAPLRTRMKQASAMTTSRPTKAPPNKLAASHQLDGLRRTAPPAVVMSVAKAEPTLPPFAALATIDARAFGEVMRACGPAVVVRALAGADDAMHRKIQQWLPASHLRELMRRVHSLSGVSLRDIDEAQRQMVAVATRLASESRIDWPGAKQVKITTANSN